MYNINLAGGIEELMYALAECPADGIVEEELLHCLELYDNKKPVATCRIYVFDVPKETTFVR